MPSPTERTVLGTCVAHMGLLQIPASGDVSGGGVGAEVMSVGTEGRRAVVGTAQRLQ